MKVATFVTYNILNSWHAVNYSISDGIIETPSGVISNWQLRKELIIHNLAISNFSIACLQEVSTNALTDLKKLIEDKKYQWCVTDISKHHSDNEESSHGVALVYNLDKVSNIALNIFNSLKDQKWYRGEIYADFIEKNSGLRFRVASTHLIGYNPDEQNNKKKEKAKEHGFRQLKDIINTVHECLENIDCIVIAGDFNEDSNEIGKVFSRYDLLTSHGFRCDAGRSGTEKKTDRKIDWIFHKNVTQKKPLDLFPLTLSDQCVTASDHLLAATEIFIPPPPQFFNNFARPLLVSNVAQQKWSGFYMSHFPSPDKPHGYSNHV